MSDSESKRRHYRELSQLGKLIMTDDRQTESAHSESHEAKAGTNESGTEKQLTPEEQMELFEQQLKEDDWGHQPC